jgi:hypothetical protein
MKFLFASLILFGLSLTGAFAQTLNDSAVLATDPTFIARVHAAALGAAETVALEGSSVAYHVNRDNIAIEVLTDLTGQWAQRFAFAVAAVSSIAAVADANGTTPLVPNVTTCTTASPPVCTTTGNLSTQAALVTDAAIKAAIVSGWNVFVNQ